MRRVAGEVDFRSHGRAAASPVLFPSGREGCDEHQPPPADGVGGGKLGFELAVETRVGHTLTAASRSVRVTVTVTRGLSVC